MKNDNKYVSRMKSRKIEGQLLFNTIRVRHILLLIQIRQPFNLSCRALERYFQHRNGSKLMVPHLAMFKVWIYRFVIHRKKKTNSDFYASLIMNFFHEK